MSSSAVNFSTFSIDDFYHPTLFLVYRIFLETSLIVTTIFFLFMLYVILKNSKDIGVYKYFMINQLIWSYALALIMGTWKPVVLWPFYMGFGVGWFRSWTGRWAILPLGITLFTRTGMGYSIFMSAFHRYVCLFPTSTFAKRYESVIFKLLFYGSFFVAIESFLISSIFKSYVDSNTLREGVISKYPFMKFFFDTEPSLVGYDLTLNRRFPIPYIFAIIAFVLGVVLSATGIYLNYIRLMRKRRHEVSIITYKMQVILFKTLYCQLFAALGLVVIPYVLCTFFAAFGIR